MTCEKICYCNFVGEPFSGAAIGGVASHHAADTEVVQPGAYTGEY